MMSASADIIDECQCPKAVPGKGVKRVVKRSLMSASALKFVHIPLPTARNPGRIASAPPGILFRPSRRRPGEPPDTAEAPQNTQAATLRPRKPPAIGNSPPAHAALLCEVRHGGGGVANLPHIPLHNMLWGEPGGLVRPRPGRLPCFFSSEHVVVAIGRHVKLTPPPWIGGGAAPAALAAAR